MATSGRTIAASGAIVVSLCSLFVMQAPIFREIAWGLHGGRRAHPGGGLDVATGGAGRARPAGGARCAARHWQPADARSDADAVRGGWARWAAAVMRRPVLAAGMAGVVLVLALVPVFGMSSGLDLGMGVLGERPTGKAQQVLVTQFSPGAVAPVQVVLPAGAQDPAAVGELTRRLSADKRVCSAASWCPARPGSSRSGSRSPSRSRWTPP